MNAPNAFPIGPPMTGATDGVVYVADAAGRPVRVRETEKLTGAFVSPDEVRAAVQHGPRREIGRAHV